MYGALRRGNVTCLRIKMEEYSWSEFGDGTLPRTKVTCEVKNVSNSYVKKMTSAKGSWSFGRRITTHSNYISK